MTAGPTTKGLNGGSKTVCIVPIQSVCNNDTDIYMYMVHEKRDETKNTSLVDNETIAPIHKSSDLYLLQLRRVGDKIKKIRS